MTVDNPGNGPDNPFPCGGTNEPDCPPEPAITIDGVPHFTLKQMLTHGKANYEKGKADASKETA